MIAGLGQALFQPGQVARQCWPDISVHHGGGNAIEFLDLRKHVAGQRDVRLGHRLRERGSGLAFVARVAVGVQITDRDGIDAGTLQRFDRGRE